MTEHEKGDTECVKIWDVLASEDRASVATQD